MNEVNILNGTISDYDILDVVGFADTELLKKYESLLPEDQIDPSVMD